MTAYTTLSATRPYPPRILGPGVLPQVLPFTSLSMPLRPLLFYHIDRFVAHWSIIDSAQNLFQLNMSTTGGNCTAHFNTDIHVICHYTSTQYDQILVLNVHMARSTTP